MFYSQRNSSWASEPINRTTTTINEAGSKIVCLANALRYTRTRRASPHQVHAEVTLKGGCFNGVDLSTEKAGALLGLSVGPRIASSVAIMRHTIVAAIGEGQCVLMHVATFRGHDHYVLALRINGDSIVCVDPWSGDLCSIGIRDLSGLCGTLAARRYAVTSVQTLCSPSEDVTNPGIKKLH